MRIRGSAYFRPMPCENKREDVTFGLHSRDVYVKKSK